MLMTIGMFARASRLSVKSLRHYDEIGLLPAAETDPNSGYRYYRVEQLARAQKVRALRLVDMPLAEIDRLLEADDPSSSLASHLGSLMDQRTEIDLKVQQLERLIRRKEMIMTTDVTVKEIPGQAAAATRAQGDHHQVFDIIPEAFGALMGSLIKQSIDPIGPPFTIFHQVPDRETPADLSMCVPIAPEVAATFDQEEGSGLAVTEVAGGPVASITHRGPYEDMGDSYANLVTWINEHGHKVLGPAREIYFNSPAEVAEADLLTEIQLPIDHDGEL